MSPRPSQTDHVLDRAFLEQEAGRIVAMSDEASAPVRVLGSLGVSLRCPESAGLLPAFTRTYADIDVAAAKRNARGITAFLAEMGYVEDREIFLASEGRRGIYDNPFNKVHLDVFFDRLEFCHVIPVVDRLLLDSPTLPLAELLLSKLQIVKINEKDVIDVVLLLLDHQFDGGDGNAINADVVARLCAADWGLWRTVHGNLEKVAALARGYAQLDEAQRARVEQQVAAIDARLEREPKSFSWRARARVGDRVKWWTDVDEVR